MDAMIAGEDVKYWQALTATAGKLKVAQTLRRQLGSFLLKETCKPVAQFFGIYQVS